MEGLIEMINVCIYRLNTVKQVLNDEGKEIEKNNLLTMAVRYFVCEIYKYVILYSQSFIKNNHENNQNGKMQ